MIFNFYSERYSEGLVEIFQNGFPQRVTISTGLEERQETVTFLIEPGTVERSLDLNSTNAEESAA